MKYLYTIILSLFISVNFNAQCTLNLLSNVDSVLCGECATLSAYGFMDGSIAFQEDFNSGSPTGWQFTQNVTVSNSTCGVPAPDGSNFMWMGDASDNPRDMTTVGFDLSLGGSICFEMRYAVQGDASPCEGPDESQEGVHVRYSIDGGATWIDIDYWDPNGGNDPTLTSWNQYCVTLPPGAETTNTMIQWHQDNVSGAEYDHWGIDNVQITLNDPSSQITWNHDGYAYPMGSSGGENPTDVCITTETTYTATITNGTDACNASITVPVRMPTVVVNAGADVDVCPGDCVDLDGTAKVIKKPAKTPTYENAESDIITGSLGTFLGAGEFAADMNINVTDLNQTTITSSSITSVCITNFTITAIGGSTSLAEAEIILTCPSGIEIHLANVGDLAGNTITNMCFQVGAPAVSTGADPYSSTFAPAQPFSNLNGCDANGSWNLIIRGDNPDFSIPTGSVDGWSITFDDPEISYPAPFTWSPLTNMTNELTLTPTVCPTATETYTLSASDSNNCVTNTDDVTVTVLTSCCSFDIAAAVTDPACGASDGGIDLTITNGSGNYTFDWGTNGNTEDLTGLSAGTYTVTISDVTDGCSKDTTISLSSNAYTYVVNTTNPSCGNSDGIIEIVVTGGTAPIEYSVDNGVTFVTSNTFSTQAAGTYDIVIRDANTCEEFTQEILTEDCCGYSITAVVTEPTCGLTDGGIDITIVGGSGSETFDWGGGITTEDRANIGSGSYTVTVASTGCSIDSTFTLTSSAFSYTTTLTQPSCGASDGVIEITITGGTAPITYSIDNGVTTSANGTFSSLPAGTYDIVVGDGTGCTVTTQEVLNNGGSLGGGVVITDLTCNNNNSGRIVLTAIGGVSPYSYSIGGGSQNTAVFDNISANTYNVEITDGGGCVFDTIVEVLEPTPIEIALTIIEPLCFNTCDGEVSAVVSGGVIAGNPVYQWSGQLISNTSADVVDACAGTYTLTVIDDNGCSKDTIFTLNSPASIVSDFIATPQPATIFDPEITLTEQSENGLSFTWYVDSIEVGNDANIVFNYPDSAGNYITCLVVNDADGCKDSLCKDVIIKPDFIFFIPNTFTPDGDGDNDFFFPQGLGIENVEYELLVFDRWGRIVWRSSNTNGMWNGTKNNNGTICQDGVYIWKLTTKKQGNKNVEKMGHVTLLR